MGVYLQKLCLHSIKRGNGYKQRIYDLTASPSRYYQRAVMANMPVFEFSLLTALSRNHLRGVIATLFVPEMNLLTPLSLINKGEE